MTKKDHRKPAPTLPISMLDVYGVEPHGDGYLALEKWYCPNWDYFVLGYCDERLHIGYLVERSWPDIWMIFLFTKRTFLLRGLEQWWRQAHDRPGLEAVSDQR